jgi:hypothetical protein
VIGSLGGAVVSLLQPAARGAVSAAATTILLPHFSTMLQSKETFGRGDGTARSSDYDNVASAAADSIATNASKNKTCVTN